MKKRNRELLGKIFASIVVLVMLVQIFLPLFSSMQIQQTTADITTQTSLPNTQPSAGTITLNSDGSPSLSVTSGSETTVTPVQAPITPVTTK